MAESPPWEIRLQRSDGTVCDVRLDCRSVVTGSTVSQLRFSLLDIADYKRAMTELRTSEERLRLARDAAGLGLYDVDLVTGTIMGDERVRSFWGIGPDEPVTNSVFMAGVHPDDHLAIKAAAAQARDPRGSGEYNCEYRVISRVDDRVRHVAGNGRVFFDGGRAVRFVGTVKDVSVLKRLERELQERRSDMEQLIKQQVAVHTSAAIAHELNQPLVSVSTYSEAALRMLRGGAKNPEKLMHALQGAVEQAHRAGRTLHELLAFLHKGETVMEPVDLNELVRGALAIAAESGYTDFHAVVKLEPGLPPVLANSLQIKKVLVNLLHNGIEAMRDNGIATASIVITAQTKSLAGNHMAQVTVQDSGPGLDAETVHRIFDPFFTTKLHGIGLGLAISRALIEAHDGQLWVDTEAANGATFHFTLPFAP